jgi:hypothetical protein
VAGCPSADHCTPPGARMTAKKDLSERDTCTKFITPAIVQRQARVAACSRDCRMGWYYAMMDRDSTTRTGAKDPSGRETMGLPNSGWRQQGRIRILSRSAHTWWKRAKGRCIPDAEAGMPGAGLIVEAIGKARPDMLALNVPAVRDFREGDGEIGIIRSPLRAIAPPTAVKRWSRRKTMQKHTPSTRIVTAIILVATALVLAVSGSVRAQANTDSEGTPTYQILRRS